VALKGRYE
jgi:hypothetical protein